VIVDGAEQVGADGLRGVDGRAARNLTYTGSLLDYVGYLERWRDEQAFAGVSLCYDEAAATK